MTGKLNATIAFLILGMIAAESQVQAEDAPPVRMTFRGIKNAKYSNEKELVTVAIFQMENLTTETIHYTAGTYTPNICIEAKSDNRWKMVYGPNWCGNGLIDVTLKPRETKSWYIRDPASYSRKYGANLRFGIAFSAPSLDAENGIRFQLRFVWSDPVEFPNGEIEKRPLSELRREVLPPGAKSAEPASLPLEK